MKPITPEEAKRLKTSQIPSEVFEVVNQLIVENYKDQGYAIIKQKEIVSRLEKCGIDSTDIYARGWLDFEDAYRASGWKVDYDKPAYNESYDATFRFDKKKGR